MHFKQNGRRVGRLRLLLSRHLVSLVGPIKILQFALVNQENRMLIDLSGRTALVTGGSRGIGRAIAERFARSGADVAIVARRQEVIDETLKALHGQVTGRVEGFSCDVSDPEAIERCHADIVRRLGTVDILVNNAGSSQRSPFLEMTREHLTEDFDLKVQAAIRISQLVIPGMQAQRWGRILNIVTTAAKTPSAASAPTTLSRAAGMALIKAMANEFAGDNILVNGIAVGIIRSDQIMRAHRAQAPGTSIEDFVSARVRREGIPLGRIGEAEEVGNLACFLASDAAAYITGTAINIDGGRCAVL
jgi:NAD(P)-dependent dehydrogenase (short-subunit alcohol dehydrogenase family)